MNKKKTLLLLMLFTTLLVTAQEVKDPGVVAFDQANKAYISSNYDVAIMAYNEVLKTGNHSADVYFNLGNAHYKKNQVGPAIYNFEKALMLDPDNADVATNLRFANQMKIDAIEALPINKVKSGVNDVIGSLSVDEWAYTSIVIVLITILLSILFLYAGTSGKKRLFFILMFIGILFSVATIAAAFYAKNDLNREQFAIVYIEEFKTRSEPKKSAEVSFIIHEGTKVQILQEFEDWYEIKLSNGSKAWIPTDAVKKL
jgi:tetratricopeptide (TPR) repeat protein